MYQLMFGWIYICECMVWIYTINSDIKGLTLSVSKLKYQLNIDTGVIDTHETRENWEFQTLWIMKASPQFANTCCDTNNFVLSIDLDSYYRFSNNNLHESLFA